MKLAKHSPTYFLLMMSLLILAGFFILQTAPKKIPIHSAVLSRSSGNQEVQVNAIYLCANNCIFAKQDLNLYPQVIAVQTFNDLKRYFTDQKIALWIDQSAVGIVDEIWLHQAPQMYAPLALIGYSDPYIAFGSVLSSYGLSRTDTQENQATQTPGFSVWLLKEGENLSSPSFLDGYTVEPAIQDVLKVTNALIYGADVKKDQEG